jgi:hypothetical protein
MRFPLDNVDGDDMEQTPAQTDRSREHGVKRELADQNLGHSDELDEDGTGDIADEGPGRRG